MFVFIGPTSVRWKRGRHALFSQPQAKLRLRRNGGKKQRTA